MTNEQPVWMHGDMLRGQTRKGSGCEFRTIPVTVKLTRKHRILTVHVHFSNFVATTVFRLCGGDQGFPVALDLRSYTFIADKEASHSDRMQPLPDRVGRRFRG